MAKRDVVELDLDELTVDDGLLGTDRAAHSGQDPDGVDGARLPLRLLRLASGLYTHSPVAPPPLGPSRGLPPVPALLREDLRLDVDGRYPQMVASGTLYRRLNARLHLDRQPVPVRSEPVHGRDLVHGR